MAAPGGEDAYVTLLLSDNYLPGALVLAHSLRDAGTTKKLAVMVTRDSVSAEVIAQLQNVFDYVLPVPRIRNAKPANLYLMNRADLHSAFTKINLWKQTQFRRIVYLDADVVACRAVDELFDLKHDFSAAPDVGWPDLFNSGVMALTPNLGDYYAMVAMAERGISFDGADQGLLNMHFKNNHHRLSFTYNVTPSAHYSYVPAYRHFQSGINIVHFIGSDKPWAQGRAASAAEDNPYGEMLGKWWSVYDRHYRQYTPPDTPTADFQDDNGRKVPTIIQYFVKGELRPPRITYVVPTGEPTHHEGRSATEAYDYARTSPHSFHQQDGQHQPHHDQYERTTAEAKQEQVSRAPEGVPVVEPEAKHKEPKIEPPPMEPTWDAQRQAPAAESKPEAANFPQTHYEMSSDTKPFVPPQRYPSPPRNMWYEVPKERPSGKPRPIFPWESHQSRPSRVFADEGPQSDPDPSVTDSSTIATSGERRSSLDSNRTMAESTITDTSTQDEPPTPTISVQPADPWASFTRNNAWDDDPAIEKYVGSMPLFRRQRGSGSVGGVEQDVSDPRATEGTARSQKDTVAGAEWKRRGSKLTDFPTAVDRPSLPVTPAPIRRPKFWGAGDPGPGDEDDDGDALPAADGVPRQSEWDPVARLQLLAQQQSDLLLQKLGNAQADETIGVEGHDIPKRPLPFGSDDVLPAKHATRSAPVHSPQPVKAPGVGTRGILDRSYDDQETTPQTSGSPASKIPEPSYHGPGVTFEKDEDYSRRSTALPPSEEEKDVLET